MRRLLLLLVAAGALGHSPESAQKLREAQQAFGAGDCARAQTALREVLAVDPRPRVVRRLAGRPRRDQPVAGRTGQCRATGEQSGDLLGQIAAAVTGHRGVPALAEGLGRAGCAGALASEGRESELWRLSYDAESVQGRFDAVEAGSGGSCAVFVVARTT